MRLEEEVEEYEARIRGRYDDDRVSIMRGVYRACVPFDFWYVKDKDVTHNRGVWTDCVNRYLENLKVARRKGYGLFFEGDNGVGKTMFLSYILVQTLKAGYRAYYTTVLDLDFNLKRGMNYPAMMERMEEMLEVDFLALDELSKEQFKSGDSWIRTQVERILKRRHDNNLPTLVAANADFEMIGEVYGGTVKSVLGGGKYRHAMFEEGDFRAELRDKMNDDMGYENLEGDDAPE